MNNRFMIIVGIGLSITSTCYPVIGARDTLAVMTHHIMHRGKAAFMRFDNTAMEIMDRQDNFGQEMQYIYTTRFPGIYKASLRRDEYAEYTFNPLFMMAREDLNYCARFLKLLREHTSLVICDAALPEDLARILFKKGCIQVCTGHVEIETVDALAACCEQLLADVEGFTIVITSLRGIAPLVQYRLLQKRNNILLFDLDALYTVLVNPMQTLIDRSRLERFMLRNIICVCTGNLLEADYQQHKEYYIHRTQALNYFGYEPYMIETHAAYPTFLDTNFNHVQYTYTYEPASSDHDAQEANALSVFIDSHKADLHEGDILVSFPETYRFFDDQVLRLLEEDVVSDIARKGFKLVADSPYRVYQYMNSSNN